MSALPDLRQDFSAVLCARDSQRAVLERIYRYPRAADFILQASDTLYFREVGCFVIPPSLPKPAWFLLLIQIRTLSIHPRNAR